MENLQRLQKIDKAGSINIRLRKETFGQMGKRRQRYLTGDPEARHRAADQAPTPTDPHGAAQSRGEQGEPRLRHRAGVR